MKKAMLLFGIGGAGYCLLEVLYCGHTHWAMFLAGGVGFCGLWRLGRATDLPFAAQAILGGLWLTAVELTFGAVFNLWLGMRIWDYRRHWADLYGQICPLYMLLWVALSAATLAAFRLAEAPSAQRK